MHAAIARCLHVRAHRPRPVLVVADGEKHAVARRHVGPLVCVDVGDIADVVAFAFEEAHRVVFPAAEKIAGAVEADAVRVRGIGAIERDFSGRRILAVEPVERLAAPVVVGRERRHTRLEQQRRIVLVVAHDEHDERLLAGWLRREPGEIDSRRPRAVPVAGGNAHRVFPPAFDEPGVWIRQRHLLGQPVLVERPGHPACAVPAVPAHSKHVDDVVRVPRADVEIDGAAAIDAGCRRVAFDLALDRRVGQFPVGRRRLAVFGLDRIGRRLVRRRLEQRDDEEEREHLFTKIRLKHSTRRLEAEPG